MYYLLVDGLIICIHVAYTTIEDDSSSAQGPNGKVYMVMANYLPYARVINHFVVVVYMIVVLLLFAHFQDSSAESSEAPVSSNMVGWSVHKMYGLREVKGVVQSFNSETKLYEVYIYTFPIRTSSGDITYVFHYISVCIY